MSTLFFPNIHTARLLLRQLTPQDAAALLAIFSDPEVMRYWNTAPWSSLETAHDFIDSSGQSMAKQASLTLGIVRKDSAELIGKCMLFSYEATSKRAEIGFGIGAAHWGFGFVPEAGQALLNYGFDSMRLRRIEAEIDPDNVASGKTLERLGFAKEGYLRQRWEVNGVVSDSALYGMLASDRAASRP